VALFGPNGSGKTTVLHMIAGLIRADCGRIELEGRDITNLPMYQRARLGIGYLARAAWVSRELNVEQTIGMVLEAVEPDRKRREYDLELLLDELDIAHLREWPADAISGSQRRRVEVVRVLAARPAYLLLDELFVDAEPTVDHIPILVQQFTRRGIGVLITDRLNQNSRQILDIIDRAYVICAGNVLGTLVC